MKPTEHTTVDRPMNGGVQPSSTGTQPIGGIARVLEDAYQLKLPVPFPLKFIASYRPEKLSDHQLRFALAETLAHLEHFADEGRAERLDGDVVVSYRAC